MKKQIIPLHANMKTKKLMLGLSVILIASLLVVAVFADPRGGRIVGLREENPRKHIVRNWLRTGAGFGDVSGWVTFACQSVEGFQYSIAVRDLDPTTTYTVQAVSLAEAFAGIDPDTGLPIMLPTSDGPGIIYPLGTINTDGEGEGEVTGLVPLPSTGFLGFGLYAFQIEVRDSTDTVILVTHPFDPIDFQVFPSWP